MSLNSENKGLILRGLLCFFALSLVLGSAAACRPGDQEDEGSIIQAAGKRPTYDKVELVLDLAPGARYDLSCHSESQTNLMIEPDTDNGSNERTVTGSTTTMDSLREVTCREADAGGALKQTSRIASFSMQKVQVKDKETLSRTLILDEDGARVLADGEEEPLTAEDQDLVNALQATFTSRVDASGRYARVGREWDLLAEAKGSPMFPYMDWDRLTEIVMELPEGEAPVGKPWERTVDLPLGSNGIEVQLVWRLKEIVGEDHEELALFAVQVSGLAPEGLTFRGSEGGVSYHTELEKMTITGSYSLVFDLDKGCYLSIDGDLKMNMALLITTKADGERHQMRAIVDNSRMRITQEMEYKESSVEAAKEIEETEANADDDPVSPDSESA
jgi:hypothetical protein